MEVGPHPLLLRRALVVQGGERGQALGRLWSAHERARPTQRFDLVNLHARGVHVRPARKLRRRPTQDLSRGRRMARATLRAAGVVPDLLTQILVHRGVQELGVRAGLVPQVGGAAPAILVTDHDAGLEGLRPAWVDERLEDDGADRQLPRSCLTVLNGPARRQGEAALLVRTIGPEGRVHLIGVDPLREGPGAQIGEAAGLGQERWPTWRTCGRSTPTPARRGQRGSPGRKGAAGCPSSG